MVWPVRMFEWFWTVRIGQSTEHRSACRVILQFCNVCKTAVQEVVERVWRGILKPTPGKVAGELAVWMLRSCTARSTTAQHHRIGVVCLRLGSGEADK